MTDEVALVDVDLGDVDLEDLVDLAGDGSEALNNGEVNPLEEDAAVEEERHKSSKKEKKSKKDKKEKMHSSRKKQRTEGPPVKRSRFVDDAAGEGESEISDNDEDVRESHGPTVEDADREMQKAGQIADEQRKKARFLYDEEAGSAEEVARDIEARYKAQREEEKAMRRARAAGGASGVRRGFDGEGEDYMPVPRLVTNESRFAASNLPRASDPKVFAIKCKPKMTRILVTRLVNKCHCFLNGINNERKKIDLGIISCFALDHIKEYIYVEASRQLFVEQALNGLTGVFRFNISVVDRTELMQLMEPKTIARDEIKKGDFVRPKRHDTYKGDLAQVVSLDDNRVHVKLVPREDFIDKPYHKSLTRQPQKFFSRNMAKAIVPQPDGSTQWGDLTFDAEGYIRLSFTKRMLWHGSNMKPGPPSMDELAIFYKREPDQVRTAASKVLAQEALSRQSTGSKAALHKGEIVRVISGQLASTVGKIVDIILSTGELKMECHIPNRPPILIREKLHNVAKFFSLGNHIVVETGDLCGESGNVLEAEGDNVTFVTDSTGKIAVVRANECRQSKLSYGGRASTANGIQLFDLVFHSSESSPFCVIKIFENAVMVLSAGNVPERYSPNLLRRSTERRFACDKMLNPLKLGCEVLFVGASKIVPRTNGTIVQLHNTTLFVRFPNYAKNSGIVAISSKDVQLVGGKASSTVVAKPRQLPQYEKKKHMATRVEHIQDHQHDFLDVHSAMGDPLEF